MRNIVLIICCALSLFSNGQYNQANYETFKENNLYGVKEKSSQKVVVPPKFEYINVDDGFSYKGTIYFLVSEKFLKSYNIVSNNKKLFGKPLYSGDIIDTEFNDKRELLTPSYCFRYKDRSGAVGYNFEQKKIIQFPKGVQSAYLREGFIIASHKIAGESYKSVYDYQGNKILAPIYSSISIDGKGESTHAVVTVKKNKKINIYNFSKRKFIFQNDLLSKDPMAKNIYVVDDSGMPFYVNSNLESSPMSNFNDLRSVSGGNELYAVYRIGPYCGAINKKTNKLIIPFLYSDITVLNERFFKVERKKTNGGYAYGILSNNKVILPINHQAIYDVKEGLILAKKDNKYGFYNKDFKLVIPFKFEKANSFVLDRAKVILNGEFFFIDKKGNKIIEKKVSSKGNMLVTPAYVSSHMGYAYGSREGYFVWDKKTGKNRFYNISWSNDEPKFVTNSKLSLPVQYLKDLLGDGGDLMIKMSINKSEYKKKDVSRILYKPIYYVLAYNTKTGKAKVFTYRNNTFEFVQYLKSEEIDKIKSADSEIRMDIDAVSVLYKTKYAHVGLITAWNTKTGSNCSFVNVGPKFSEFYYYPKFKITVPSIVKNSKGDIMMDISSYTTYGEKTYDQVEYNHFLYNTFSQEISIVKVEIPTAQFYTGYFPKIRKFSVRNERVLVGSEWNTKYNTASVSMSYAIMNYGDKKYEPVMTYINDNTGLGLFGLISKAYPNHYLKPGSSDYPSIRNAIAKVKAGTNSKVKAFSFVERASTSKYDNRYVVYSPDNGKVQILNYNLDKKKYEPFLSIDNNVLFK